MDPIKIATVLKKKIIFLDLAPETLLNLSELAAEFGVSRTPIKEALIALYAEGWVLRHGPHFMVSPLTLERIREITELRVLMEIQANIWAMERMTPEHWAELMNFKEELKQLDEKPGYRVLVEMDLRFHRILYRATQNANMAEMLERMLNHYLRFRLSVPRSIDKEGFYTKMMEIITAMELKDHARLREATYKHISESVNEIMGLL